MSEKQQKHIRRGGGGGGALIREGCLLEGGL